MKPEIVYDQFERRKALPNGGMWVRYHEVKIRFANRDTAFAMIDKLEAVFKGETSAEFAMGYGVGFDDACAPKKPLTEQQVIDLFHDDGDDPFDFARAIEAAHGIKENT